VPGGSLRDVLDDFGPLRETVARDYARQVLTLTVALLHAFVQLQRHCLLVEQ
jgi:hypothetical protein